jgi:hypothetical protein
MRARAAYWTYWIVFLLVPAGAFAFLADRVGIPTLIQVIGIGPLFLLAAGPGDRLYRWWNAKVWRVPSPSSERQP